jgi:hypothetical protein
MLTASCHCQAVQISLDRMPESVTQCTCSICRRYAALWAYCTRATARLTRGDDALCRSKWNDEVIEFCFCRNCGCLTHYEDVEKDAGSRFAVNARMMEPTAIDGLPVRTFDGASM